MTSARDQQINALFRAALERPVGARAAFVSSLAGDDVELSRSVEVLLAQHDATDVGAAGRAGDEHVLAPGTQLGQYRIDGVLGRGGMGVVYRATDTKLERPVAIKFLSRVTADEEAKRRFRQEATTASSLNHPHIVTVYDVGEHEGQQFIVSELVDGGTLDDWATANRHRTWRQCVDLLAGVADGLAAAHAAGVLHRDVKPGNVLIGSSGYAKLADFGLAKLLRKDTASALAGASRDTRAGVVIGTIAYMSPEQAAGRPLDARSDVFSFGVMLYELLAGRRPFEAANDLELLKTIVHGTPAPLPDTVPELLRIALDKALEKEPGDRYQTMGDLAADLRRASRKSTSSQTSAPASSDAQIAAAMFKRHRVPVVAAGVLAALVVVGTAYLVLRLESPTAEPAGASAPRAYEITQLTTSGKAVTPAISPDGKYVVYAQVDASGLPTSLWVRQLATTSNVQVVAAEPGTLVIAPTVTPDSTFIDYVRASALPGNPELWRIPFLGGTPRRLAANATSPVGWSPDGKRMAFIRGDAEPAALIVIDGSGNERVLASRSLPTFFVSLNIVSTPAVRPSWSPDGSRIALYELTDILAPRVVFIDTETGAETIRDSQGSFVGQGIGWLGPSSLVLSQPEEFGQRVQLWRMSYPDGAVEPLTNDLSSYLGVDVDASRSRVVTTRRDVRTSVWTTDAAGRGATEIVPSTPYGGANAFVAWAGDRLLYDATLDGRAAIAGVTPGDGAVEEVVASAFHVAATSDGGTIVFGSATRGRDGLWKVDGSGRPAVQLFEGFAVEPVVTADDRSVVFLSTRNGSQSPWIVPLDGGEAKEIVREFVGAVDVSRDGRLAFLSGSPRGPAFTVCGLPECSNREEIPVGRSLERSLRWTPDGRELAYISDSGQTIFATPLDGGPPRELLRLGAGSARIASFAWSPDGDRLAFIRIEIAEDVVLLSGLRP